MWQKQCLLSHYYSSGEIATNQECWNECFIMHMRVRQSSETETSTQPQIHALETRLSGHISIANCICACACTPLGHTHFKRKYWSGHGLTGLSSCYAPALDYEYRLKNKGTGLILVPRKCAVYKWDQESFKMYTVSINIKYTQNAHPHTPTSHQFPCLLFTPLLIMVIDTTIKVMCT